MRPGSCVARSRRFSTGETTINAERAKHAPWLEPRERLRRAFAVVERLLRGHRALQFLASPGAIAGLDGPGDPDQRAVAALVMPEAAALERHLVEIGGKRHAPYTRVPGDLHAPLVSYVPALLLSGGDDPVTPSAYGAASID